MDNWSTFQYTARAKSDASVYPVRTDGIVR